MLIPTLNENFPDLNGISFDDKINPTERLLFLAELKYVQLYKNSDFLIEVQFGLIVGQIAGLFEIVWHFLEIGMIKIMSFNDRSELLFVCDYLCIVATYMKSKHIILRSVFITEREQGIGIHSQLVVQLSIALLLARHHFLDVVVVLPE